MTDDRRIALGWTLKTPSDLVKFLRFVHDLRTGLIPSDEPGAADAVLLQRLPEIVALAENLERFAQLGLWLLECQAATGSYDALAQVDERLSPQAFRLYPQKRRRVRPNRNRAESPLFGARRSPHIRRRRAEDDGRSRAYAPDLRRQVMRHDMDKVLVERPRTKPYNSRRNPRPPLSDRALDLLPSHEPIKGHLRGVRLKQLNENLSPLWRFLASRVGQPWNKVHSELRESMDVRNPVQLHIFQHLDSEVRFEGHDHDRTFGRGPMFHVVKGILRKNPNHGRYPWMTGKNKDRKVLDPNRLLLRRDNVWYLLKLKPLPTTMNRRETTYVYDPARRETVLSEKAAYDVVHDAWLNSPVGYTFFLRFHKERWCRETHQAYGQQLYCAEFRRATSKEIERGR